MPCLTEFWILAASFEKRSKKLLLVWLRPLRMGSAQFAKVFWFFFCNCPGMEIACTEGKRRKKRFFF
jgi:hypothetical protein